MQKEACSGHGIVPPAGQIKGEVAHLVALRQDKMDYEKPLAVKPRIILHGGAGNITRSNLTQEAYNAYKGALLEVLHTAETKLHQPAANALDVATYAVTRLEDDGLFNSGHGAVYTTAGTHELEASVMVSRGYRKRGCGVMRVTKAKNPILLAREMLMRGELEDGGGAQGHCQLSGETCDRLAEEWGLKTVRPSYFWTKKRWDEHRRGLGKNHDSRIYRRDKRLADEAAVSVKLDGEDVENELMNIDASYDGPGWDGKEYLPQGTVGAIVLDSVGTLCVATSTGGLTNKLPGRVGDTPTLGAGFWAQEWHIPSLKSPPLLPSIGSLASVVTSCLPVLSSYTSLPGSPTSASDDQPHSHTRAVAMSGTGNGDSFLRLSAVHAAASMARFASSHRSQAATVSLQDAVSAVAGPNGMLQQSAEDRWLKTGEGEGGERTDGCKPFRCLRHMLTLPPMRSRHYRHRFHGWQGPDCV